MIEGDKGPAVMELPSIGIVDVILRIKFNGLRREGWYDTEQGMSNIFTDDGSDYHHQQDLILLTSLYRAIASSKSFAANALLPSLYLEGMQHHHQHG